MTIEDIKNRLADGSDLSAEQMQFFLQSGLQGKLSEAEKIEVLSLLNSKGIAAGEVAAAAEFLRKKRDPVDALDNCGTGGSGLSRINTSTLAALILAAAGVPIAKHGNRAASGRCGSFDLLEALGVKIDLSFEQSVEIFERVGIAFFFAPKCYPEMAAFGTARKAMGVPTIFNLLGPLISPLNPKRHLTGVSSHERAKLVLDAYRKLGKEDAYVVVGDKGLDEISLSGNSTIYRLQGGVVQVSPADFGFEKVEFDDIAGGDVETNVAIFRNILEANEPDSARSQLIYANVAVGLQLMETEPDLKKGASRAREMIVSGKAAGTLEKVREISHQV